MVLTVEAQTQWLVWRLMRVPKTTGSLTTAALRLETLLTILPILADAQQLPDKERKELKDVIAETKRLSERRNTVIHTQWDFGSAPGRAKTYSFKMKKTPEEFTPAAINAIGLEISNLLLRMGALSVAIIRALRGTPLPRRHGH